MIFEQYYLECLSHASYLVGDEETGRAIIVDPQRDVSGYLDDASRFGLNVELIVETHFHADFLSGHLELARRPARRSCTRRSPRPSSRRSGSRTARIDRSVT